MNRFWALAGRDWPPKYPAHQLATAIGAPAMATLLTTGVLREQAICPYDTVPCTACRASARVLFQRGVAVVICTGNEDCPDEVLGPAPSWAAMDAGDFTRRLAQALELEGLPGVGGAVVPLGGRRIGEEPVAFDLCTQPSRTGVIEALTRLARTGPQVRVVLVPDSRRLRADLPCEIGETELVWAGLDEVLTLDGELGVDLTSVYARRRFRGLVSVVPFDGLVVGSDGAWWGGRRIIEPEFVQALTLLRVLSRRLGEIVTMRELWRGLWPSEHTAKGELARLVDPDDLDERLRQAVREVRAALVVTGIENLVENKRKVGYRLNLEPGRIRIDG